MQWGPLSSAETLKCRTFPTDDEGIHFSSEIWTRGLLVPIELTISKYRNLSFVNDTRILRWWQYFLKRVTSQVSGFFKDKVYKSSRQVCVRRTRYWKVHFKNYSNGSSPCCIKFAEKSKCQASPKVTVSFTVYDHNYNFYSNEMLSWSCVTFRSPCRRFVFTHSLSLSLCGH
jgi:hypothetical protein